MLKSDELYGRSSGLDIHQALNVIASQAYTMFEGYFVELTRSTDGLITTKTATDIASSMAVQLLTPIMSQIDPLRLGEMNRFVFDAIEKRYIHPPFAQNSCWILAPDS